MINGIFIIKYYLEVLESEKSIESTDSGNSKVIITIIIIIIIILFIHSMLI